MDLRPECGQKILFRIEKRIYESLIITNGDIDNAIAMNLVYDYTLFNLLIHIICISSS